MKIGLFFVALAVTAPLSVRADLNDEDEPVTYQCPTGELLTVHNKSSEYVKMYCSPPIICGETKSCVTSAASSCSAKSQYLAGVEELTDGGNVRSTCCQISPPLDSEEPCHDVEVHDESLPGWEGPALFKAPPPEYPGVPVPAPRVASLAYPAPPAPEPNANNDGKPATQQEKADLLLYELTDRGPPTEMVKAIQKIPNGYRITLCTPTCRSTTSTVTSIAVSSTSTKTTTVRPSKPTPQKDEHGVRRTTDSEGRPQTIFSGAYCRQGFQQCQSQCRATLGVQFLTAACVSSSEPSGGASVPADNGGSKEKGGGGSREEQESGRYQQCVCTERKQDAKKPPPPVQEQGKPKGMLSGKLGNGQGCFSGDMTVVTPNGRKRMDELHAGDEVLVLTGESDQTYQPIEWFYHRDIDQKIEFITLETSSGHSLSLTPNHMVPLLPCRRDAFSLDEVDKIVSTSSYFASRAKIGHCVGVITQTRTSFESDRIVRITRGYRRGVYSPITSQGTIVVNGIQTSCYSSLENQPLQRTIHSVLIKTNKMIKAARDWYTRGVEGVQETMEEKDVPAVLAFLLEVAKTVIPSYVYV